MRVCEVTTEGSLLTLVLQACPPTGESRSPFARHEHVNQDGRLTGVGRGPGFGSGAFGGRRMRFLKVASEGALLSLFVQGGGCRCEGGSPFRRPDDGDEEWPGRG